MFNRSGLRQSFCSTSRPTGINAGLPGPVGQQRPNRLILVAKIAQSSQKRLQNRPKIGQVFL